MVDNKKGLAVVLLLLLSLIWGSSLILIKKGLVVLSPQEVGSLRIVSAFLCLAPIAIRQLRKIKKNEWKYLLAVGLCGSFIPSFLFAIAQTRIDSAVAGILNALTPIFTILISLLIYHHKFDRQVYYGVFLGFIGSIILVLAGASEIGKINFFGLFIVLATVFYGTNLNVIKEHLQGQKALTITSISLLLVGPLASIYLFGFTDFIYKIGNVPGAILATSYIVFLGVLGTAVALIIFNYIVQLTNPLFTSSVTYIIPIIAVFWGILDGEKLLLLHYLGMIFIVAGVYIANSIKKKEV